jgi:hypothetical protein
VVNIDIIDIFVIQREYMAEAIPVNFNILKSTPRADFRTLPEEFALFSKFPVLTSKNFLNTTLGVLECNYVR